MVRFLLLMFFAFLLQSCKKDINYSNNQIEDIENLDFDVSAEKTNSTGNCSAITWKFDPLPEAKTAIFFI